MELGRDPNLVKCTDNYEDAVDCRGTRKLLAKFRKMEMQAEDGERVRGNRKKLLYSYNCINLREPGKKCMLILSSCLWPFQEDGDASQLWEESQR